jgi:hypothetical protein
MEQSSKRGGRSAQLKPTVTCQKQKLYCSASSGRAEECASTIYTKLAPWRMVKFILRSRPEIISGAPAGREDGSLGDQHPSRRCKPGRKSVSDILLSFHPRYFGTYTEWSRMVFNQCQTRTSGSVLSKLGSQVDMVLCRVESARFKVKRRQSGARI